MKQLKIIYENGITETIERVEDNRYRHIQKGIGKRKGELTYWSNGSTMSKAFERMIQDMEIVE